MDQNNSGFGSNSGIGINSGSDMGNTGKPAGSTMNSGSTGNAGFGAATGSDTGTCAHCGQPLGGQNKGLEQFLGRIGISEEMINNLKSQMQNVDVEEYLNTARDYLRGAGDKAKTASTKAGQYAKDNPKAVAAGVAVLAVGAGLLINAMRDKDTY